MQVGSVGRHEIAEEYEDPCESAANYLGKALGNGQRLLIVRPHRAGVPKQGKTGARQNKGHEKGRRGEGKSKFDPARVGRGGNANGKGPLYGGWWERRETHYNRKCPKGEGKGKGDIGLWQEMHDNSGSSCVEDESAEASAMPSIQTVVEGRKHHIWIGGITRPNKKRNPSPDEQLARAILGGIERHRHREFRRAARDRRGCPFRKHWKGASQVISQGRRTGPTGR